MKALIVDDEPLARLELCRLLTAFPWVRIVGEAGNIDEAKVQIEKLTPEIIFLDVQMPGGTGFDLLERLDQVPRIIFTTAYDKYAVKAFDVNALDYLLKPVEPERLAAALDKGRAAAAPDAAKGKSEKIFVRDGPRCWFLPVREVSLIVAEGNYARLHWGKERPLLGRSLAALVGKLDAGRFFRVSRQHIVNLDFIEKIEPGPGGRLLVQLRDGEKIEISRRHTRLFRAKMMV